MMAGPVECIDVAIAIVRSDDRILISQRPPEAPLGGLWEFPGGKCEPGETPIACLERELREELGIGVTDAQPLAVIEHDYPHGRVRLHPFLCRLSQGTPRPLAARQIRWIAPDHLASYPFPPANQSLLAHLATLFRAAPPRPD